MFSCDNQQLVIKTQQNKKNIIELLTDDINLLKKNAANMASIPLKKKNFLFLFF